MFGKNRVSQSVLDAVNSVIGEEPVVENKKPKAMLSEEIVDFNIDPRTGKMIEVKDYLVSGYERPMGKKQIVMIEEEPNLTPETLKGQILKKKDDKKASVGKSAIAMSAEETELDEEGNCVTPMKAKKIADKEVGKHEKEMHKESMTFKERLLEKSVSTKQARTMAAAAHNPSFAKKVGIPQDVAKDFNKADKGTKMLSKAMKGEEVELDEMGDNSALYNQSAKTSAAKLNALKSSQKTFDFEKKQGLKAKANMTHEETEVTESLKDMAKKILSKVGHPDDKGMRKDLQKKVGVPQTGEKPKNEEVEGVEEAMRPGFDYQAAAKETQQRKAAGYERSGPYSWKKTKPEEKKTQKEEVEDMEEGVVGNLVNRGKEAWHTHKANKQFDKIGAEHDKISAGKTDPKIGKERMDAMQARIRHHGDKAQAARLARTGSTLSKHSSYGGDQDILNRQKLRQKGMAEDVGLDENAFTDYKTDKKPSIFSPKSHTAKKTEKGTMYTKNWSKKDMEHKDDDKMKKEAVDKEADKHVRVDGETDMNTKTVDGLRGRMKVPADYHNKSKSYKVAMPVGEEMEHDDEKEDKALVKKMVKKDALKKTDEAFKGPEAGSGVGDHPFVTSEAKPLKNARELAKKTMARLKNEMLGKISN